MTHTCNYNTCKVKAKGLKVQSQPWLHRKLEASWDYTDIRLKKKEDKRKEGRKEGQCDLHIKFNFVRSCS